MIRTHASNLEWKPISAERPAGNNAWIYNILCFILQTLRVQVDDVPSASLSPYFDKVADKIQQVTSRGGKVLVHCMAGVSRSSTLCIAYLMKHKG